MDYYEIELEALRELVQRLKSDLHKAYQTITILESTINKPRLDDLGFGV